jgi:hypothetical protein
MRHLSLVKPVSRLREEQRQTEEVLLEHFGLEFTRGTLSEIVGRAGSGKRSLALSLLAKLTSAGEICAVVDSCGGFDPCTAHLAGVQLENLLWIRCGGDVEKAFISADHLVQAKGFGAIWLDLTGLSERKLRMVPKTYWYRYRTRIKETPTLMFVTSKEPITGSASQRAFEFSRERTVWSGKGKFKLLREFYLKMHSRKEFYADAFRARIEVDYRDL